MRSYVKVNVEIHLKYPNTVWKYNYLTYLIIVYMCVTPEDPGDSAGVSW